MSDFLVPDYSTQQVDFTNVQPPKVEGVTTTTEIDMTPKTPSLDGPLPDESIAKVRSGKYHLALGDQSPGRDVLTDSVLTGTEKVLRNQAAQTQFLKDEEARSVFIRNFISNNPKATKEDLDVLRNVPLTKLRDPKVILEELYAGKVINETTSSFQQAGLLSEALKENNNKSIDSLNATEQAIANKEYAQKKLEEVEALIKQQSFSSKATDVLSDFVPFLKNYRMTNLLKGAASPFFPGTNRQDQYTQYYLNKPETSATLLDAAVNDLKGKNLHQAREYLQGLLQYSSSDQFMTNLTQALDISTVPGVGKGFSAVRSLGTAANDVLRASGGRTTRPSQVLEGMGDLNNASLAAVVERLDAKAVATTTRRDSWESLKNDSTPIINPAALSEGGSSTLSNQQVSRLVQDMETNAASVLNKVLGETLPISRVMENPQVLNAAVEEARRLWTIQYPNLNNSILGVRPATNESVGKLANVEHAAIELGTRSAELFHSPVGAKAAAEDVYGLRDFNIKQRGTGYYIEVLKPLDERSLNVFNQLQVATNNSTPRGLINTYLGFLRSAEDTTNRSLLNEGRVAQYGSSQLTNVIRSVAQDIGKLRNPEDFSNFLHRQQIQPTPGSSTSTGYRSKTIQEFERDWQQQFNRLPEEQEVRAYFNYSQLHSLDYMVRNLSIYNSKNRLGLEMFDFPIDGVTYKVPTIEGKLVDRVHFDQKDIAGIVLWNRDTNLISRRHSKELGINNEWLDARIAEGYKIVQLSSYGEDELKKIPRIRAALGDQSVDYVLTRDLKSSPIPLQQIPNRDGWHVSYPEDGYFIRQPNINVNVGSKTSTSTYYGDHNLLHFNREADAVRYNTFINEARTILRNGDMDALRTYLGNNLPVYSLQDFVRQFRERGGILNHDIPTYVTPSGRSVQDTHKISDLIEGGNPLYPNFRDKNGSVYNLYRGDVNLQFAQERNATLNTIEQLGSPNAPVLQLRTANLLDPVETLNRSTSQLMRGRYMDDLKIKAAQQYVAEFNTLFDGTVEEINRNPFHFLTEAPFKKGSDPELLAAAKNSRRSIINMLGLQSDFDRSVAHTRQRLSDDLLPRVVGRDGAERIVNATQIVDGWALGAISDPGQFFRNVAFNLKMGLFNPVQLFKQANTFTHIAAIAGPMDATRALFAATMSRAMDFTLQPQMLRNAAGRAVQFGWTREQFVESYNGLQRSGFQNVGREHQYLGDFLNPSVIQSAGAKVLDHGTFFFREGEALVRNTAWHASYLEWRKANPTAAFNDVAMKWVLNRADVMNVNMSHISNSPWQTGPTAVSAQFFGYSTRLTEQMLGYGPNRRFTDWEKLRVVGAYSAMYGLPIGLLGTTTGAFGPVHESYFSALRSRGIDADQNAVLKTINEGIPSVALKWATGLDFNVKESWGPGGNPFIRDLVTNDKGFWGAMDLLGGAGFKTTHETLGTVANLVGISGAKLLGLGTETVPVTAQDFVDVLENATSANQARKLYYALNAAEYHTKSEGVVLKDITKLQGYIYSLTGLEPTDLSKMHGLIGDIKSMKKDWQAGEKRAEQWINLWAKETTSDLSDQYLRKAKAELTIAGVPVDEQVRWLNRSLKGKMQPDIIKKLEFDYAKDNQVRLKAFLEKGNQ